MTPNVFIIGAPKCGTTSVVDSLADHPQFDMGLVKEPGYYASDVIARNRITSRQDYEANYIKERPFKVDATVFYMYSNLAIPAILRDCPNARFIIFVRDPMKFVLSYHAQEYRSGNEKIRNFKEAWDCSYERAKGYKVPRKCEHPELLNYQKMSDFLYWINMVKNRVNPERVKIYTLKELKADECIPDLLNFLGADQMELLTKHSNQKHILRSVRVKKMLNYVHAIKTKYIGRRSIGIGKILQRVNQVQLSSSYLADENEILDVENELNLRRSSLEKYLNRILE